MPARANIFTWLHLSCRTSFYWFNIDCTKQKVHSTFIEELNTRVKLSSVISMYVQNAVKACLREPRICEISKFVHEFSEQTANQQFHQKATVYSFKFFCGSPHYIPINYSVGLTRRV